MIIKKIFNNNVVLVVEKNQNEVILMGKGIAFQKKIGELIDESKVDKKFVQGLSNNLSELLKDIPQKHLDLTVEIIKKAKAQINTNLSDYIYITLTDHLDFAITRALQGLPLQNPLLWEIKKIYSKEFNIGIQAIDMIKKKLGVLLPEDEAGSIALHIVNAQNDIQEMEQTIEITKLVQGILQIVKYHFGININQNSINYNRFLVHLRFFAQRLLENQTNPYEKNEIFDVVQEKYPLVYECVVNINQYVKETTNISLSKSEMVYLMLHIQRVTDRTLK